MASELTSPKRQEGSSFKKGRVVHLAQYLSEKVQDLLRELAALEKTTGLLMNRLIREKDQAVARRLQHEIGHLDADHERLDEQLRSEKKRRQRYLK